MPKKGEAKITHLNNEQIPNFEDLSPEQKRIAHERYTLIAGVLPFLGDNRLRSEAIKPENLPCKDSVAFAGEIYVLSYAGKKKVSAFTKEYLKVKNSGQLTPPNPSDIHSLPPPCARKE